MTTADVDLVIVGGGQSGLATAATALAAGLHPVLVERSTQTAGSWPRYYDSLRAFSPAGFCALPGRRFPGDPHRYPTRDEIARYLRDYRDSLDLDIRTGHHVHSVCAGTDRFLVRTTGGELSTRTLIAATGMFGNPNRPTLPGSGFTGRVLHAAEYRSPAALTGQKVIVVGGGNTAVQIAVDLTATAEVTLATRGPIRWQRRHRWGRDIHWWLDRTGLDTAPIGPLLRGRNSPVLDDGQHHDRIRAGRPRQRSMFNRLDGKTVSWPDGSTEHVDAIILATGYRPDLPYLQELGALDAAGRPHHRHGVSTIVPGLGFVGLEYQRSISSATLRGVGRDAQNSSAATHPPPGSADRANQRRISGATFGLRPTRPGSLNTPEGSNKHPAANSHRVRQRYIDEDLFADRLRCTQGARPEHAVPHGH